MPSNPLTALAFTLLALLPASLSPARAADARADQDRVDAWQEDVLFLVDELVRLHPDPWFGIPEDEFAVAVDELLGRLPELSDDAIVVELMRLVARIAREGRDGHTAVWPTGFRILPVQVYGFEDGWYVVAAAREHERLVGMEVVAIGGLELDEVCRRVAPLLTRDNAADLRAKLATMLLSTELLHAVGVTPAAASASVRLRDRDGETYATQLDGQTIADYARWNTYPPVLPPADAKLRWLRTDPRAFWSEVLPEARALYVRYAAIQSDDGRGVGLADFVQEQVRTCEEQGLERLVLDLRVNGGGDNTTFGPWLERLAGHATLDRPGHLFVLTSRHTFSAAGNFVTSIQRRTNAMLVGESTGGAPNQYGDATLVSLPNHKDLLIFVSTRLHRFAEEGDERLTHEPDVRVALTSRDWFEGRDPVLEAALAYGE